MDAFGVIRGGSRVGEAVLLGEQLLRQAVVEGFVDEPLGTPVGQGRPLGQAHISDKPKPTAAPCTLATTGLAMRRRRMTDALTSPMMCSRLWRQASGDRPSCA